MMQDQNQQHDYWNGLTDYGRGHEGEPGYAPVPEEYRSNGMSKACLVCGILSLAAVLLGLSFPIGALGILFGLLSRDRILSRQAKTGIALSAAGMAAFVVTLILSIVMLVTTGLWDFMVSRIQTMDPTDPVSVATVQQEILDEVMKRAGLTGGTGLSGFPEEDGAAAGTISGADSTDAANAGADSTSIAGTTNGTDSTGAADAGTDGIANGTGTADTGTNSTANGTGAADAGTDNAANGAEDTDTAPGAADNGTDSGAGLTYGTHDGGGDLFA